MAFVWVFLGGGLGSLCRYGIARYLSAYGYLFPWATLLANALACFLLGLLIGLKIRGDLAPSLQFLLITGFCGGFSTFSTFSYESFALLESQHYVHAFANMSGSMLVGLLCVFLGLKVVV